MEQQANAPSLDTSGWASPEEYNSLIRAVELRSIRMASGEFSAPPFSPSQEPIQGAVDFDARYEEIEGGFIAFHRLRFAGTSDDASEESFSILAEYAVEYESEVEMTQSLFLPFMHLNLPVNTWPYFREFVQSSLARLDWPKLTLPALRSTGGMVDVADSRLEFRPESESPTDEA